MNAQSRMAKTLGCLVFAMTAGALVLYWIEPSSASGDSRYAIQLLAREVKQAVRHDASPSPNPWRSVVVRAGAGAMEHAAQPHFRITSQGELSSTAEWKRQRSSDGNGVIEVLVEPSRARDRRLPLQQINTFIALIDELRHTCLSGDAPIEVDEPSFAAGRPGEGQVRANQIRAALRPTDLRK